MDKERIHDGTDCQRLLDKAEEALASLDKHIIDVLEIKRPYSIEYAKQLVKVISKLSPLLGNIIEFSTVDILNEIDWNGDGKWIRQDPGFPDALFLSDKIVPNPGIEIKAWFPFATEITARFRDSSTIFKNGNINLALIAWLPEHVIWGRPQIIDTLVVSGESVADARNTHYHRPPDYIVFEPEYTSGRTANLQQTNTNGYKLQGGKQDLDEAINLVNSWGNEGKIYSTSPKYQRQLKSLLGKFTYRLDTNYAKIDRIEHKDIEAFKLKVLNTQFNNKTIKEWSSILSTNDDNMLEQALNTII